MTSRFDDYCLKSFADGESVLYYSLRHNMTGEAPTAGRIVKLSYQAHTNQSNYTVEFDIKFGTSDRLDLFAKCLWRNEEEIIEAIFAGFFEPEHWT